MAAENDSNDAINNEEIAQTINSTLPRTRRTPTARIPPQKGEADVTTTVKYRAPLEDIENDNQTINGNRPFQINNNESPLKNAYPQANTAAPTNRLADMFAELGEYQEYDEQQFLCFLVRRGDYASDKFRRRALAPENFQPFPITVKSVLDLISTIQEINGNSGGRFDIRVLDENGTDTEIGIAGFIISDPPLEKTVSTPNGNAQSGDLTAILEMMREERQRTDERFQTIFNELSKPPKESELEKALRQKMINDLVNPPLPQNNAFNADEFITKVFTSQAILETVSNRFAEGFGSKDKKESTLEMILGNEMIMNTAKDTVAKVVSAAENVIVATQQKNSPQNSGIPPQIEQTPNIEYSSPPIIEPTAEQIQEAKESMDMLNEIIAELESDNAITRENETFVKITTEHPKIFKQLEDACKVVPFETILEYLEGQAPETFEPFYADLNAEEVEFNERGIKVEKRLRELYDLLRM